METITKKKLYEGMFLVDSARAGSDWDGINAAIKRILQRAEAEIVSIRKWDDRRLAYEIQHVGRGTYILVYFRADGQSIQGIEKAVQLSEQILRVLILNAEHITAEEMEKDTPASKAEREEIKSVPAAVEMVEEDRKEALDDLQEAPAEEEKSEGAKVVPAEAETGTKEEEDAEVVGEAEQAGEIELTEEEEESQPRTVLDDESGKKG